MEFQQRLLKGSDMPADYLSRNVEEAIRVSDEDFKTSRKTYSSMKKNCCG
jgi:hypothetical protein